MARVSVQSANELSRNTQTRLNHNHPRDACKNVCGLLKESMCNNNKHKLIRWICFKESTSHILYIIHLTIKMWSKFRGRSKWWDLSFKTTWNRGKGNKELEFTQFYNQSVDCMTLKTGLRAVQFLSCLFHKQTWSTTFILCNKKKKDLWWCFCTFSWKWPLNQHKSLSVKRLKIKADVFLFLMNDHQWVISAGWDHRNNPSRTKLIVFT